MEPQLIYQHEQFLALAKPAGLLTHPVKSVAEKHGTIEPSVVSWVIERFPEVKIVGDDPVWRPGIVHRLDKDTSGILLVARTQACFEFLKSQFQAHTIRKTYKALVRGIPSKPSGDINLPIGIREKTLKRSVHSSKMAKEAITHYAVAESFDGIKGKFALLDAEPKTGRTHQLRVHFTAIGHPIVGDRLYGPKDIPSWATRLMLHAYAIEFDAAPGEHMRLEADMPTDFEAVLNAVR